MDVQSGESLIDGVLGGGGAKGFAHLGFLKACEEMLFSFNNIYGISIGSQVAALYTNGFSVDEIRKVIEREFNDLLPKQIVKSLTGKFKSEHLKLGIVDLCEINRQFVKENDLVPNDKLRIVSYNLMNRKPVIYKGTDYDLADALSASMAVPLMVQPVILGKYLPKSFIDIIHGLISGSSGFEIHFDGAIKHPCPGDIDGCYLAIVSKLGFVSRLPGKFISPFNMMMHGMELLANPLLKMIFPDSNQSVVIDTGPKNIAALNFGQFSSRAIEKMVNHGYEVTADRLAMEILAGRL